LLQGLANYCAVLQFQVLTGKQAGTTWVTRRFPVRIGRLANSDLCLNEEGVWDQHLVVNLRSDNAVEAVTQEPALALVNGKLFNQSVLQNGDVIAMGATELRFGISSARQRSLGWRELMTWIALSLLTLGQVALIYWLG
jgi:hypothetical protein